MSGVNKVFLVGRLGADPELRSTPAGQQVATLSLATSEAWTDRDGKRQERTEWHRIVLWQKLAELAAQYLTKGSQVCIEGKIQTRQWEKDGEKRYSTEIVGQQMTFLGDSKGKGEARGEQRPAEPQRQPQSQGHPETDPGYFDSEVPF